MIDFDPLLAELAKHEKAEDRAAAYSEAVDAHVEAVCAQPLTEDDVYEALDDLQLEVSPELPALTDALNQGDAARVFAIMKTAADECRKLRALDEAIDELS